MKNILLPTDFSDNSWQAIQYALQLFADESCTFYVLNSFKKTMTAPISGITSKMAQRAIYQAQEDNSRRDLKSILDRMQAYSNKKKHHFEIISMYHVFTDAVVQCLETYNIDMVIMGTLGSNALKDMTVGSNTAALVGRIWCPLIAVPQGVVFKPSKEIGLATDYDLEFTETLLEPLLYLLKRAKAKLSVCHILGDKTALTDAQESKKKLLEDLVSQVPTQFYTLSNTMVSAGIQTFADSRKLDMLSIIAKKHNFMERLFDKTYSKNISKHARIPLLVLNNIYIENN